jgi:hypothetical protein
LRGLGQHQPQRGVGRENLRQREPDQVGAHLAQEFLDRAGGHHQAAVAPEHQHGVLQLIEKPLEVAAQIGEIELRAAELLAQQIDLGGHDSELIGAGAGDGARAFGSYSPVATRSSMCPRRPSGRKAMIENSSVMQRAPATDARATLALFFSVGMISQRFDQRRVDDHPHIKLRISGVPNGCSS